MAIDVGIDCDTELSDSGGTLVEEGNPANATGTIDYVCGFWKNASENAQVGAFSADGDDLTCVEGAYVTLPNRAQDQQEYNAPGDFTAFNININEYIGIYAGTAGDIEYVSSGSVSIWFDVGDQIPCAGYEFTPLDTYKVSIYATGTETVGAIAPTGALYGPLVGPMGGPI